MAGFFWDGADVINALWYALERNPEMAIASAIFAIPGAGIGIGNFMMKGEKLASAGKAVRAVSKFTQSAIGVGAGMSIATVGYQNLRHSIEAGEFSLTDLATFIGGLTIAAISGKGLISSGKDLLSCSDDLAKMWKNTKSRVSENFRKFMNDNGGFLDLDALVGKSPKTYQTYTKVNPVTGVVYSGRTSGTGTPADNVRQRDANHHMNAKGFGPAVLDKSSDNYEAIRGREQMLIDYYEGAQSMGGRSGNAINGIASNNPKKSIYIDAAKGEFGDIE